MERKVCVFFVRNIAIFEGGCLDETFILSDAFLKSCSRSLLLSNTQVEVGVNLLWFEPIVETEHFPNDSKKCLKSATDGM